MSSSHTPVELVERDSQLARLTTAARRWKQMDLLFKKQLPPALAAKCRAVRINDEGVMIIFADNGTIAARLKLLAPSLLPMLDEAGFAARRIQIKVVLHNAHAERQNQLQLSRAAIDAINQGAEAIQHPDLAESLRTLARHHQS